MNQKYPPSMRKAVIAIDGPSGSGKSSVAKGVARELGLDYLDTGAIYRAMTWWMVSHGIDVEDPGAVAELATVPVIESTTDPDAPGIFLDGRDVADPIRGPEVTAAVSLVSAVPEVRDHLLALQRGAVEQSAARGQGIVVEGRDIGSVVLPNADVKVFLTAHPSVRAQRRSAQDATATHGSVGLKQTEASLRLRDQLDSSRASAPLVKPQGAVEVDATHLTLPQVINAVVALVRERLDQEPRSMA